MSSINNDDKYDLELLSISSLQETEEESNLIHDNEFISKKEKNIPYVKLQSSVIITINAIDANKCHRDILRLEFDSKMFNCLYRYAYTFLKFIIYFLSKTDSKMFNCLYRYAYTFLKFIIYFLSKTVTLQIES